MVGGRTVEVDLALSQHDARNLASGGRAPTGAGKDNRNLYLVTALPCPALGFASTQGKPPACCVLSCAQ